MAPRTRAEERVAKIFSEVLGVERVGVEDDFFALGGHSLLAIRVALRVRAVFGVELPLRTLFEAPTVELLAVRIERSASIGDEAGISLFGGAGREGPLPLSFAQQRLWLIDQLEPGSPLYNIPAAVALTGKLDVAALAAALGEVVRRHEALRTTFPRQAGEPMQVIAEPGGFVLPQIDLAGLPEPARAGEASRLAHAEARRPFDLGHGPLLRAALLRLGAVEHTALVTMHHIVSDGWSMGVLVRELGVLYGAFVARRPSPLPELALQYADFATWQRGRLSGELLEAELAWWRERLAGLPPALELPTDHPRPAVRGSRGAVHGFTIGEEGLAGLTALSRQRGATLFMTLLAGFTGLLGRYTGEDDFAVGTPIAGRTRAETEPLIGLFVNTLVLRADLAGDPELGQLVSRVRETTLAAYGHQEVPFERLVEALAPERDASRPPLVQVMFALQNAPLGRLELPGLALAVSDTATGTAKFELTLTLVETERGLEGKIESSRDLFEAPTVERLAGHFVRLLAGAAAVPGRRLSELPLLSAAERGQLLVEWNDAAHDFPQLTLHEAFERQAGLHPGLPAVVSGEAVLTYRELDRSAGRLAGRLRALGVGPETPVAIYLERSAAVLVAILGVLKAGGAYLPLDTSHPAERLATMLEGAGRPLLITERRLQGVLTGAASRVLRLDEASPAGEDPPAPPEVERTGPEALAYVLHTSGSTGKPKGVCCTHRGVLNLLADFERRQPLAAGSRGSLWTSLSFDVSVYEVFSPLLTGGAVHVVPEAVRQDGERFLDWLLGERIDSAYVPPFLVAALCDRLERTGGAASLRRLLVGVEPIPEPLLARIGALCPGLAVINGYGPTEATICATLYDVDPRRERFGDPPVTPIGRPAANSGIYLLDRRQQPVPVGVPGELYIAGAGLARGYLGSPGATAERFVPHPLSQAPGERLYRTGDLARWRPDGNLEFLSRIDHQIKLRGLRIEPGEIESALLAHPALREAVVTVTAPAGGEARENRRLVAYVVGGEGPVPSGRELRDFLRERLPGYMVPSAWVALPALPLNANGKLDRKALPEPRLEGEDGFVAPRTPAEERVAEIFSEVLGVARVGVEDDFFSLGGHSLLAVQVALRVRSACGVELPLRTLFEAPTAELLAARIERSAPAGHEASKAAFTRVPRDQPLPLSFAQQRLWFLDQLDPGSALYNIPARVELTGKLDAGALAAALGEVVRRHEALRTTFPQQAGEPAQAVAEPAGFALPLIDLEGLPGPARREEMERLITAEVRRPFDLGRGPLLRMALVRSAAEEHSALVTMHHIVSDGWSMGVLVRELGTLYGAFAAGHPSPLPELAFQYADFAAWQRTRLSGALLEAELAWWREELAGLPPALELPTDHPRPADRSMRGASHGFAIGREGLAGLAALSRRSGATLFMTLLAGFAALLERATGESDLAVGTPIAGRTRMETEPLIGFFINTLALRLDLSGAPPFLEVLGRIRETTLAAYAHQELPFDRLIEELAPERDRSRPPVFQVVLALQNAASGPLALSGLNVDVVPLDTGTAKFELSVVFNETGEGLSGLIEYSQDLFDAPMAGRLAGQLTRLLAGAVADPSLRLPELPLLSAGERHQLLSEWNDTAAPFPETTLLHEFFEAAAERAPEAVAAVCSGRELTYAELEARSNRLARLLRGLGIERGAPVGVWAERSLDMLTAVFGVLKAGGHYVALDEAWPADRVESILASTGAPALVAGAGLLPAVEEMRWRLPALADVVCLGVAEPEPPAEALDPESVRELWDFVAERAVDRETAGGFVSAFTGQPMSGAEVDEYRDRVLSLAEPWLRPEARVLEIGSGSGLLLWEMASRVAQVTGVDPSPLTQERNREHMEREGVENVALRTGFAHELDGLLGEDERFDLVLLASTVQFFPGPRYLERVIRQALGRLAPGGAVLVADVLDAGRREELRRAIEEHRGAEGAALAARRRELYLDAGFFRDLGASVHLRTEGFPNELRFRYDVVLTHAKERGKRLWTGWHADRCPAARLPRVCGPGDVAYVIHTSGSTGEPKGIVVQHRPAANLVDWINRTFEVGPEDRGLFVTSLCFDLSVYDIFGVLGAGGTVHVATKDELGDPGYLVHLLRSGGITLWDSAPAALVQLAPLFPGEPDAASKLRRVLLSGDWIPVTLPDRVRRSFPGARVLALGGATEATVWSNWFPVGEVDPDWPSIPYGRPISNARYHVLDAGFTPCPVGIPGDLYIGGDCLCAGYRRPELTAKAFLPDPFSGTPGARLYRTGDRARYRADGNLE
ncbi:MAG TPA: amino acid adenylation domain-containing protein, partial [Thermoanaerobaculia bacterium]|nr:amino acid adenylation domain-containing protein [Thermoanaerobaculia bacterium]